MDLDIGIFKHYRINSDALSPGGDNANLTLQVSGSLRRGQDEGSLRGGKDDLIGNAEVGVDAGLGVME